MRKIYSGNSKALRIELVSHLSLFPLGVTNFGLCMYDTSIDTPRSPFISFHFVSFRCQPCRHLVHTTYIILLTVGPNFRTKNVNFFFSPPGFSQAHRDLSNTYSQASLPWGSEASPFPLPFFFLPRGPRQSFRGLFLMLFAGSLVHTSECERGNRADYWKREEK